MKLVCSSAGSNNLPDFTEKLTECYAEIDVTNRWQGDVYPKEKFSEGVLPTPEVPYWMLVNRTCQLFVGEGRETKLPYLNFVAVVPLSDYIKNLNQGLNRAIPELVKGKLEGILFLPDYPEGDLNEHLVVNFNLIYTVHVDKSPEASDKLMQLSSPFCEYAFQKFSRYFYTVGYDDKNIKSKSFIKTIVDKYSK
ncbi:MAG: hypothetical protein QM484_07295 [Woeseiaceae bacterium]